MMDEGYNERLERLARQTHQLSPSPGFVDRVMSAVQADAAADWYGPVLLTARWGFLVASLIAVTCGIIALQTQHEAELQAAVLFGTVQYPW